MIFSLKHKITKWESLANTFVYNSSLQKCLPRINLMFCWGASCCSAAPRKKAVSALLLNWEKASFVFYADFRWLPEKSIIKKKIFVVLRSTISCLMNTDIKNKCCCFVFLVINKNVVTVVKQLWIWVVSPRKKAVTAPAHHSVYFPMEKSSICS